MLKEIPCVPFANMRLRLNSTLRRVAFALGALVLAAFVTISSTRTLLAWSASQADPPTNWTRAARLEPANAEWHCDLGIYHSVLKMDPQTVIPELETSVHLNPHNAACWTALGEAYARWGCCRRATNTRSSTQG